jgi:hypothetical protein
MTSGLLSEVKAQPQSTRIVRVGVNGKEVKKSYRIFSYQGGLGLSWPNSAVGQSSSAPLEEHSHMLDERFSASAFSVCGIDTNQAQALADLLAEEVQKEMQEAIEQQFVGIVKRLNEMGHNLKPETIAVGQLSYKDDYEDDSGYHCKLRLALDLVVSTGYADLI